MYLFFFQYGGNAAACAAALAVMEVVENENLKDHALKVGDYLLNALQSLYDKYEIIGEVRGHGLFAGIELVTDRHNRVPATLLAKRIVKG
jgi:ethanolamine-phosphate phospho-lyase